MDRTNKDVNSFIKTVVRQYVLLEELDYFRSKRSTLSKTVKTMIDYEASNHEFVYLIMEALLKYDCTKEDILNAAKEVIDGDTYNRFEDSVSRLKPRNEEEFTDF